MSLCSSLFRIGFVGFDDCQDAFDLACRYPEVLGHENRDGRCLAGCSEVEQIPGYYALAPLTQREFTYRHDSAILLALFELVADEGAAVTGSLTVLDPPGGGGEADLRCVMSEDRKSTRLNSSH